MLDDNTKLAIASLGFSIDPCGSQVTCHPAPAESDHDYLLEAIRTGYDAQGPISRIVAFLEKEGWKWEGDSEHYQQVAGVGFMSWRKGKNNLIITANANFAKQHRLATSVCKRLNIMDKKDRVAVFRAFLYGEAA